MSDTSISVTFLAEHSVVKVKEMKTRMPASLRTTLLMFFCSTEDLAVAAFLLGGGEEGDCWEAAFSGSAVLTSTFG